MNLVLLGKVVGTHGIRGEVKILSDSDFKKERFKIGNKLYLKSNKEYLPITINSYRVHKGLDLIKFNNIDNINDVLSYINLEVYAEYKEMKLQKDEYYHLDLLNCKVFDLRDNYIGEVKDLRELPQGILLEIVNEENKISLVPFNKEFVTEVDIKEKKIFIDPIEGLL